MACPISFDQLDVLVLRVNDHDAPQNADLRPREADAVGVVHRLKHIVEQICQLFIKFRYRAAFFVQNRVALRHNVAKCHIVPSQS